MKILILSQVISDILTQTVINSFADDTEFVIISGSSLTIRGNINLIDGPRYDSTTIVSRFKSWLQFAFFEITWIRKNPDQYDMVYASSNPPIHPCVWLFFLRKRLKAPFVYVNWDIYPQILSKKFSNICIKAVASIWNKLNNYIYPKIDRIITIGDVLRNSINETLNNNVDIEVVPLPTDTTFLYPRDKSENDFVVRNELKNKFVVLYSGKMGEEHSIDLILNASKELKSIENICFVFIGHGSSFKLVDDYIKKEKPKNVRLFPLQPYKDLPLSMSCGDIGIVSQAKETSQLFFPSKVYDLMASGVAVLGICNGDDDLTYLINDNHIGDCVVDFSSETLSKKVLELYKNKNLINEYKQNARNLAVKNYDIESIAKKYNNIFNDVIIKWKALN